MKSRRVLIHALDLDQVALSADAAGLYEPFDAAKPARERRPRRELDPDQRRRYVRIVNYERHPDGTLIVEAHGDAALAWAQQIADLDAEAQRERKRVAWEQRAAEEKARADAAALANAQLFAASLDADPTPGTVTVTMTPALDGGQLIDTELEDIEPPTPPAAPAARRKRSK